MLLANASASAAASPVDAMIPSSCQLVVVTTSTGTSGPRNAEKYLVRWNVRRPIARRPGNTGRVRNPRPQLQKILFSSVHFEYEVTDATTSDGKKSHQAPAKLETDHFRSLEALVHLLAETQRSPCTLCHGHVVWWSGAPYRRNDGVNWGLDPTQRRRLRPGSQRTTERSPGR